MQADLLLIQIIKYVTAVSHCSFIKPKLAHSAAFSYEAPNTELTGTLPSLFIYSCLLGVYEKRDKLVFHNRLLTLKAPRQYDVYSNIL